MKTRTLIKAADDDGDKVEFGIESGTPFSLIENAVYANQVLNGTYIFGVTASDGKFNVKATANVTFLGANKNESKFIGNSTLYAWSTGDLMKIGCVSATGKPAFFIMTPQPYLSIDHEVSCNVSAQLET